MPGSAPARDKTYKTNKANKTDMDDSDNTEQKPELKLDAQTLLTIAQALSHVSDLETIEAGRMTIAGAGTLPLRTGVVILRRILTLPRMIVLADKAAENPAWWRANRLAYYTTMKTKDIARWCGITEKTCRKYINEPEIGEDMYEALPPEDPFI